VQKSQGRLSSPKCFRGNFVARYFGVNEFHTKHLIVREGYQGLQFFRIDLYANLFRHTPFYHGWQHQNIYVLSRFDVFRSEPIVFASDLTMIVLGPGSVVSLPAASCPPPRPDGRRCESCQRQSCPQRLAGASARSRGADCRVNGGNWTWRHPEPCFQTKMDPTGLNLQLSHNFGDKYILAYRTKYKDAFFSLLGMI